MGIRSTIVTISARRRRLTSATSSAPAAVKRDAHPATILADPTPSHETLAHQAVTHSGRGRPVDAQRHREVGETLRTSRGQHDQHAVLRKGHILSHVRERTRSHRHKSTTRAKDRVNQLVSTLARCLARGLSRCRRGVQAAIIA